VHASACLALKDTRQSGRATARFAAGQPGEPAPGVYQYDPRPRVSRLRGSDCSPESTPPAWLSVAPARRGFDVVGDVVPDSVAAIAAAMRRAVAAADAVLVCGGLGPTLRPDARSGPPPPSPRSALRAAAVDDHFKRSPAIHVAVPEETTPGPSFAGLKSRDEAGSAPGQRIEFRGKDGRPRSADPDARTFAEMSRFFEKSARRPRATRGLRVASFTVRLVGVPDPSPTKARRGRRALSGGLVHHTASGAKCRFHATARARGAAAPGRSAPYAAPSTTRSDLGRRSDATLESSLGAPAEEGRLPRPSRIVHRRPSRRKLTRCGGRRPGSRRGDAYTTRQDQAFGVSPALLKNTARCRTNAPKHGAGRPRGRHGYRKSRSGHRGTGRGTKAKPVAPSTSRSPAGSALRAPATAYARRPGNRAFTGRHRRSPSSRNPRRIRDLDGPVEVS